MSLRLGALHDALLRPGDATLAREAAEEVARYEERMAAIDTRLSVLQTMCGTIIALQLLLIASVLAFAWRLIR